MAKLLLVKCGASDEFVLSVSDNIAEVFISDPVLEVVVIREDENG